MQQFACSEEALETVAEILNGGGVGVIPTDTVYGLAAHPAHSAAVERLYEIKGRENGKPIALLAADADAVTRFGFPLGATAAKMAAAHWPGALTLVVENPSGITEGFRVPAHDWTRRLIEKCGGLLRVTSANISGQPPATTADAAKAQIGDRIDFIVDDGASRVGTASKVVLVSAAGETKILRP